MKRFWISLIHRFVKEELGQTFAFAAISITTLLALAGSSVEVAHIYYAYHSLVASTNAAAMAGAQTMGAYDLEPSLFQGEEFLQAVNASVVKYSSESGQLNANTFLSNDSISENIYCSSTMQNSPFDVECQAPPAGTGACSSSATCNVITVTQTAQVPLWIGGLLGMRKMNMSANASAVMRGGQNIPYNLAIIMDTTASMQSTIKNDPDCTSSQISCAVQGLMVMLENMDPCPLNETCPGNSNYVDSVALFVFPALNTSYSANDYNTDYCSGLLGLGHLLGGAKSVPYNFVNVTPGSSQNLNMENTGSDAGSYEIIPFNNSYKQNDSTQNLVTSAALAEAVGYGGSGCSGLSAPGGQGTYYAQVIYQAQSALATEQSANPGSKNIMIILTDGDATASASSGQIVAENNPSCTNVSKNGSCLNGTGNSSSNPSGYNNPAYPSAVGMCGQAVQAAQDATAAGTIVYTIGFGSETSGCTSDQTYTLTGLSNGAETWPGGANAGSPCNAIAAMASNSNTFYSDNSGGCPAISATNSSYTSMAEIFKAIVTGLTNPRLIPNGTS